jgi:hypothetical protein
MNKKYLYIITRKDLTPCQITVQSIHVAYEVGRYSCKKECHPSVVFLKANNENELNEIKDFLGMISLGFKEFVEPYYNNSLTAIALSPIEENQRDLLRQFKLFRNEDFKLNNGGK